LLVKQHLIVLKQLSDSGLCPEVVLFIGSHSLVKVKLNELSHIEFVVVVVFHTVFEETIYQLTDLSDWGALSQFGEIIELFGKWIEKYVN
jgi:DNA-binding HxlR family transcriptional regulator